MNYLTETLIVIAITMAPSVSSTSFSYNPGSETSHNLIRNDCDRLREGFREILLASKAPGGMVILHNSECEMVSFLDLGANKRGSLTERLDVLVEAVPSYEWRKRDGVVNLEPLDTKIELLDAQVPYFAYRTGSNVESIMDSLMHTSEFRQAVTNSNLTDGLYFGGLQSPPSTKSGTEIVLQDKSVRQILNDIVQRRKRGLWVYSERNVNRSRTFTLKFVIQ